MLTGCPDEPLPIYQPPEAEQCEGIRPCHCDARRGTYDCHEPEAGCDCSVADAWVDIVSRRSIDLLNGRDVTQLDAELEALRPDIEALVELHREP